MTDAQRERMRAEMDAEVAKWRASLECKLAACRLQDVRDRWWYLRWLPWNWFKECP